MHIKADVPPPALWGSRPSSPAGRDGDDFRKLPLCEKQILVSKHRDRAYPRTAALTGSSPDRSVFGLRLREEQEHCNVGPR
jgi:hypothetical protein